MNAIIIYQGKYGATKQYAIWLGEDLELRVQAAKIINGEQLARYDTLLIGSSIYIGKLQARKWLRGIFSLSGIRKYFSSRWRLRRRKKLKKDRLITLMEYLLS